MHTQELQERLEKASEQFRVQPPCGIVHEITESEICPDSITKGNLSCVHSSIRLAIRAAYDVCCIDHDPYIKLLEEIRNKQSEYAERLKEMADEVDRFSQSSVEQALNTPLAVDRNSLNMFAKKKDVKACFEHLL